MEQKPHCQHYQRNCHVQAPCCGVYFPCKVCHDEQFQFKKGCQVDRMLFSQVTQVKCLACGREQQPSHNCVECSIEFGKYCCLKCKLYENNPEKIEDIFHCEDCGMCRRGSKETVTHCLTCGYCVPNESENHKCIANKAESSCPVCLQILIYSVKGYISLKCGHLIHVQCWQEMNEVNCPTCGMANVKMPKRMARRIQKQIKATKKRLPGQLKQKKVSVLCNQCLHKSMEAPFHFFGVKCEACGTYNTKLI